MKLDITQQLKTMSGEPLQLDGKNLTFSDIASEALSRSSGGSPDSSLKRYKLAKRFVDSEDPKQFELTVEEASDLKTVISQQYSVLVAGQAIIMIEGGSE